MQPDPRTNLSNQLADTLSNRLVAPDEKREITITFRASYAEKARHSDKEHDHTHIVASRVNNLDGKSIRTWNNYAHSEHSARLLEREFQLTQIQSSWESNQKAMTRSQLERVERDGLPGEEIMRRAIEQVAVNKPTIPQLIEQLWSEHQVKAIISYYGHGGVRGIKFGIDVGSVNEDGSPRLLWKQGGNLNKYKCSFTKLQTELGISYDPKRDDSEIKRLNQFLESVPNNQNNQQVISTILAAKIPVITEAKHQIISEPSAEIYQDDTAALQNLLAEEAHQLSQKAINAIADFIERSVVEPFLSETLPQLTEQLSQYRQQLSAVRTAYDELLAAIVYLEQLHRSQKTVDAIAENKAQTLATDEPKLKDNLSGELYKHYSADLQNLLGTDRDKEIAIRALLDNKPAQDFEEILQASPAGWTQDEARELVLIANSNLASSQDELEVLLLEEQQISQEFLAIAVPIAVELINWQLRESGDNNLRFKHSTLSKQGKELVFTHDDRGEIFRVAVNRNQSGELEYSAINVGQVKSEDLNFWQEADRVLQQLIEESLRQSRKQTKGISL